MYRFMVKISCHSVNWVGCWLREARFELAIFSLWGWRDRPLPYSASYIKPCSKEIAAISSASINLQSYMVYDWRTLEDSNPRDFYILMVFKTILFNQTWVSVHDWQGYFGFEPRTSGLEPDVLPLLLYPHVAYRRYRCRRTNCIGFDSLYRIKWHVQWRPTVLTPGKRSARSICYNVLLIKTISSCRFLTHILIIP